MSARGNAVSRFHSTFGFGKPIIGMIHLRGSNDAEKLAVAREEIDVLCDGGVDAVLVEDYFGSPEIVERVVAYLAAERQSVRWGVKRLSRPRWNSGGPPVTDQAAISKSSTSFLSTSTA
jgi:hypothetical protein